MWETANRAENQIREMTPLSFNWDPVISWILISFLLVRTWSSWWQVTDSDRLSALLNVQSSPPGAWREWTRPAYWFGEWDPCSVTLIKRQPVQLAVFGLDEEFPRTAHDLSSSRELRTDVFAGCWSGLSFSEVLLGGRRKSCRRGTLWFCTVWRLTSTTNCLIWFRCDEYSSVVEYLTVEQEVAGLNTPPPLLESVALDKSKAAKWIRYTDTVASHWNHFWIITVGT